MKMSRSELTAKLAAVQRRGRATRYPPALRTAVVEYCEPLRAKGMSWNKIGKTLRTNPDTLRRWDTDLSLATGAAATALVPVEVVDVLELAKPALTTPAALWLSSPDGYRVEGLTVELAAQLLRALR